jgi:excisionase family DNA binding protein
MLIVDELMALRKHEVPLRDSTLEAAPVLTVQDVAEYLHVHQSTIYRLIKTRHLPAYKVGRDWRFNRKSIERWCADAELLR